MHAVILKLLLVEEYLGGKIVKCSTSDILQEDFLVIFGNIETSGLVLRFSWLLELKLKCTEICEINITYQW